MRLSLDWLADGHHSLTGLGPMRRAALPKKDFLDGNFPFSPVSQNGT